MAEWIFFPSAFTRFLLVFEGDVGDKAAGRMLRAAYLNAWPEQGGVLGAVFCGAMCF
jgi:hypothetical protein